MNKLDLIKVKHSCFSNDTVKRMKGIATDWGKIFSCHTFDRSLESEYIKTLKTQL